MAYLHSLEIAPIIPPVVQLSVSAREHVSARADHVHRKGELLAVEHKQSSVIV